ncbi:MAG: sugar ABC transporter permease [Treponema sp. RIFOXYC1_FULL_61_9]|nr:MAG: sugar ABC transporter permease [Treponema sp. GWA1_62_8]OHE68852.1 MAG: sugar ABC transporter permease [Treponema sp. GWC1_61_84]OHE71194.1 MAG: sugar ABC transporter permease [Treponema sp. RIFOXYC1_FULL_61_9]
MKEISATAAKAEGKKPDMTVFNVRAIVSKYGIYFIFLGMLIIASLLSPAFMTPINLINIIRQISIIGLIALGVTGVIVSAGIDLSSGSVVGMAAVVAASLVQTKGWSGALFPHLAESPLAVAILAACLIGVLAGAFNGFLVAKTGIPPFIATLGMVLAVRGAAMLYTNGRPVSSLTDEFNFIGQGSVFGVPVPIIILAAAAVFTHILYSRTKFGKYIYAIGGNEQAARVSGINVVKYKIIIYIYAGFLAAVAGLVVSSRIGSGQPGLGVGYEFDAIAAAVIGGASLSAGGIGTIPGTIVGALIIGVLNNILDLTNVSAYWQQILRGGIIVGAVILDQRKNRGGR